MNIVSVDEHFSRSAQIGPGDLAAIRDAGFKTIVCARPDGEDPGQPSFETLRQEGERLGLTMIHAPLTAPPTPGKVAGLAPSLASAPRPIFGYCRSGARAEALYRASRSL